MILSSLQTIFFIPRVVVKYFSSTAASVPLRMEKQLKYIWEYYLFQIFSLYLAILFLVPLPLICFQFYFVSQLFDNWSFKSSFIYLIHYWKLGCNRIMSTMNCLIADSVPSLGMVSSKKNFPHNIESSMFMFFCGLLDRASLIRLHLPLRKCHSFEEVDQIRFC